MSLTRLIYISEADRSLKFQDVVTIRDRAVELNRACHLTGFLVFGYGRFLQVLEGDRTTLNTTFRRILADPRHSNIHVVECRSIPNRDFNEWKMNLLAIGPKNQEEIEGLLARLGCPSKLNPSAISAEQCLAFLKAVAEQARQADAALVS